MGGARASGAVFRALAENFECIKIAGVPAGEARPATPEAGVLPQPRFSGLIIIGDGVD